MQFVLALLFLLSTSVTSADSWVSPQPVAAVSDNAEWLVRVVPGESIGDVYGFGGEPTGPFAEATLFQYDENAGAYTKVIRFRTRNPVAPVEALITNEGLLITLDNWHNFGIGTVLATYDISGDVVQTLTLSEIFNLENLHNLERSVSSIWWRCGPAILDPIQKSVGVWDSLGRVLSIGYLDGEVKVVDESDNCVDDDT